MAGSGNIGVVAGSANARVGIARAIEILRDGGAALDAAVAAVRCVEDNREDSGVGTGGIPNLLGEVELDAAVMDGRTLAAGSVGAIKNYPHPVDIARKVMEVTPHVMLVGAGAELFARYHGFSSANILTPEAEAAWRKQLFESSPEGGGNAYEDQYRMYMGAVRDWTKLLHREIFGTTNVLARDRAGHLAVAVSTSGWGFKWPGRLGDTPLIGAGCYADDRFGAAACTGRGELAIRACSAHSVIAYLRAGRPLWESVPLAMEDLRAVEDPFATETGPMNIVAMDRDGGVFAAGTSPEARYVFQTTEMETHTESSRFHVPLR